MSSMRVFQLGLRRAAVPNMTRFQTAGRMAQRRYGRPTNNGLLRCYEY
jgi:succinate dehydrogenase (ubiquinone) cytochrome b560 subunit